MASKLDVQIIRDIKKVVDAFKPRGEVKQGDWFNLWSLLQLLYAGQVNNPNIRQYPELLKLNIKPDRELKNQMFDYPDARIDTIRKQYNRGGLKEAKALTLGDTHEKIDGRTAKKGEILQVIGVPLGASDKFKRIRVTGEVYGYHFPYVEIYDRPNRKFFKFSVQGANFYRPKKLKESTELEQKAFELGYRAWGKYKAPVNDPELMKLTKLGKVGSLLPYLKAWTKGLQKASLEENVKNPDQAAHDLGLKAAKKNYRKPSDDPELSKLLNLFKDSSKTHVRTRLMNQWTSGLNKGKNMKTESKQFHSAAPAVVSGNLEPIGKRDPNRIPPKFAMLLKDIGEDSETVLRLLVTYSNGDSIVVPPANEPGAVDGNSLLAVVLDFFGTENEETVRVLTAALDRVRDPLTFDNATVAESRPLSEENISDRYQKMVDAMNVLSSEPSKSPASMSKLEAIGVIRDMGYPDEKIIYALSAAGHSQEEINTLLAAARLGVK